MSRQYNSIYSKLVKDENDIIGHVAYSLYKSGKADYISNFKAEHGKEPEEEDLEHFHRMSCMEDEIFRYRMQATSILRNFTNNTLSSTIRQIEDDTIANHKESLKEVVSEMKPAGFWYGVGQSVVGALLFMLLMCIVLFFLNFSESEYTFTFGGNGSAKIEKTQQE